MFEVGFSELLVIFALALVVLGPERLPKLAAQVGRWIGRARAMARQFRDQLEAEANIIDPMAEPARPSAYTPPPSPAPAAAPEPPAGVSPSPEPAPEPEHPHERGV